MLGWNQLCHFLRIFECFSSNAYLIPCCYCQKHFKHVQQSTNARESYNNIDFILTLPPPSHHLRPGFVHTLHQAYWSQSLSHSLTHSLARLALYSERKKNTNLSSRIANHEPTIPSISLTYIHTPHARLPKKCHSTPFTTNIKPKRWFFLNSFAYTACVLFFPSSFLSMCSSFRFSVFALHTLLLCSLGVCFFKAFHFCLLVTCIHTITEGEGEPNVRDGI